MTEVPTPNLQQTPTVKVRAVVWNDDKPEGGKGALNIGLETATLHPDTVIEETTPGTFKITHPDLVSKSGPSAGYFDADSRCVHGSREFHFAPLLRRLQEVPRGQAVELYS